MSDYVWPHRWQPTRLPHPWDSPGKNTGVHESERWKWRHLRLSDPMDCSLPGSSIQGIFQARVLECGAIAFSATFITIAHIESNLVMSSTQGKLSPWFSWWMQLIIKQVWMQNAGIIKHKENNFWNPGLKVVISNKVTLVDCKNYIVLFYSAFL